MHSNLV